LLRRGAESTAGFFTAGPVGAVALPVLGELVRKTPVITGRAKYSAGVATKSLPKPVRDLLQKILVQTGSKLTKPKSD
jgi:hypothetical protein